jgi:hypothetical protein
LVPDPDSEARKANKSSNKVLSNKERIKSLRISS